MGTALNYLIFPRQRLKRVQPEVDDLSDAVIRLYDMDLSGVRWAECREGVVARLTGGASPELLVRIPSAKLEGTALMVYLQEGGGWGSRLCWKGTVEDAFEIGENAPPDPVTPAQHAARLARRFPKLDREVLLSCLTRDASAEEGASPADIVDDFLGALVPWARELLSGDQLAPAPDTPIPDCFSPQENTPDWTGGQRPPRQEPGIETCLPLLTGVRALRRSWSFPLSLLYTLFPKKRPRPEAIPHAGWTAQELHGALEHFHTGELDRLELDFTVQGEGTYIRRLKKTVCPSFLLTLVLLREGKRCMCLLLDDQDSNVYRLIADREPYMTVDSEDLERTTFHGQTVEAYAVFQEPRPDAILREVSYLLARLDRRDDALSATARMGVWSREGTITNTPADKERHQEQRRLWCLE